MDWGYIIIIISAIAVATLTFFSGFGLGSLLMPVFAIFFPIQLAIAATAVVHLANNIFKAAIMGKYANIKVVLKFAVPAAITAIVGALLLNKISLGTPIFEYHLGNRTCSITLVKLVISMLIIFFAIAEFMPSIVKKIASHHFIPLGGAISGFFGGLSGHQGALRTAFLIQLGLKKKAFIGTIALSALTVDIVRLSIYGATFLQRDPAVLKEGPIINFVLVGILAAFAGTFIGSKILKKVTMRMVQRIVGIMLVLLAISMGLGII